MKIVYIKGSVLTGKEAKEFIERLSKALRKNYAELQKPDNKVCGYYKIAKGYSAFDNRDGNLQKENFDCSRSARVWLNGRN